MPQTIFKTFLFAVAVFFGLLSSHANATILEADEIQCPIGGEIFKSYRTFSVYTDRIDIDFRKHGPAAELMMTYPECPSNGFVVFKKFTATETEYLKTYINTRDYYSARRESVNYRAYLLKKQLGSYSDVELGDTLLRATWQAKNFWQYRKYAEEALSYYTKESDRLRDVETTEAFHSMHIRGDLNRRLMKFWDAYKIYIFQSDRPGVDKTIYGYLANYEKSAILTLWFGSLPLTGNSFWQDMWISTEKLWESIIN